MEIKRYSKLVRWAYLFEVYVPYDTNVCALFWRCVLFTPLKIAMPTAILIVVACGVYQEPLAVLGVLALVIGIFPTVGFVGFGITKISKLSYNNRFCKKVTIQRGY